MTTFEELVASRRQWIEEVLRPWCVRASRKGLKQAEQEWGDIAGRADPDATLWTWAWSRFPALVHEGLSGVSETYEVRVTLKDGTTVVGFPENRLSKDGRLVLLCTGDPPGSPVESDPYSIDDIESVERT